MANSKYLKEKTQDGDPYIFNNAANEERKRVDKQSWALNILMHDKPIHAPISNPTKILDVGYGTGLMCSLFGRKFPKATIYGIDPSPPAVGFHQKPDNVEYIQGRYEDLLESGDPRLELASFDYVFARMAICWITDWPSHISRIMSLLKPGGWAEFQELSVYTHFAGDATEPIDEDWGWPRVLKEVCLAAVDSSSGINLERRLTSGGFKDVKNVTYPLCLCKPWPGKPETGPIAEYTGEVIPSVTLGLLDKLPRDKFGEGEIQQMKDAAMETAFSGKIDRLYMRFDVCIGRKAG